MCSRNAVTIIACLVLSIFLSSNALAQSGVATTSTSAIESGTLSLPAPTRYFNDTRHYIGSNADSDK